MLFPGDTRLRKWRILHLRSLKKKRKNGQLVSLVCDYEKKQQVSNATYIKTYRMFFRRRPFFLLLGWLTNSWQHTEKNCYIRERHGIALTPCYVRVQNGIMLTPWHLFRALAFFYARAHCAYPNFNNLKKEWSISVTHVRLWKKIRMRYLWTYCIVFVHYSFFLVTWNLSARWKNLLLTCKKWQ